jgi:hypothetical protein
LPSNTAATIIARWQGRAGWIINDTSGPTTLPLSAPRLPISSAAVLGRTGYVESFNARLRDELLNGEIFYTLREAQIVIESWRRHYNTIRPHASLGYRPAAPEVFLPAFAGGRLRSANRLRRPRWRNGQP